MELSVCSQTLRPNSLPWSLFWHSLSLIFFFYSVALCLLLHQIDWQYFNKTEFPLFEFSWSPSPCAIPLATARRRCSCADLECCPHVIEKEASEICFTRCHLWNPQFVQRASRKAWCFTKEHVGDYFLLGGRRAGPSVGLFFFFFYDASFACCDPFQSNRRVSCYIHPMALMTFQLDPSNKRSFCPQISPVIQEESSWPALGRSRPLILEMLLLCGGGQLLSEPFSQLGK